MPEGEDSRLSSEGEGCCTNTTASPSPLQEELSEDVLKETKNEEDLTPPPPLKDTSSVSCSPDMSPHSEGGDEEKKDGGKTAVARKDDKPTLASIVHLFRYATKLDWLLMILGAIAAILHGFILPVALLFLDFITSSFTYYEVSRFTANVNFSLPLDLLLGIGQHHSHPLLEFSELTNYDPDPDKIHVIVDILSLTGGLINCSRTYLLQLPYPYAVSYSFTIEEVVQAVTLNSAVCYSEHSFLSYMDGLVVGLIAMAMITIVLGSLQVLFFHAAAERQVKRIRLMYFHSTLCQDRAWYDEQLPGGVSIRLSHNIEKIDSGLGANLSILIQFVTTFFAGLAAAFYKNWELTLILLALMPLIIAPSGVFNRLIATFSTVEQNHYASAGAVAEEVLSAIRTVVAFGGEHREVERYEKHLSAAKKLGVRRGVVGGVSQFVIYFALFSSFGVSFWYGAYIVAEKKDIGGSVLAVLFSVVVGAFYLGQSTTNFGNLLTAATAAKPIFKTIDTKAIINPTSEEGVVPSNFSASIEFKNVSFSYPSRPSIKVLDKFNLSVGAGECVAVVGPSGGGKSTSISLLQRFYDVTQGQVLVGGVDVRELNVKWLRSQIGIVSQEPTLFNTSIKENIQMGREDASMADIIKAAKTANAHGFITALPCGYNTMVGEQGAMLSGGQKQRIAIARALVRDPKILLLDEATSALDTENETTLQETLSKAAGERTVVLITHRLPLVKCADRVVSVENGSVEWTGTPSQLYDSKNTDCQVHQLHHEVTASQRPLIHTTRGQTLSLRRQTANLMRHTAKETRSKYNTASLLHKVLSLNRNEWWVIVVGVMAAGLSGAAFPLMAVMFGGVFGVFLTPSDVVIGNTHPWAVGFVALGAAVGTAFFIRTLCFSVSGESLTHRIRYLTFKAMLRQEIGWFDDERNDTGVLTHILSDDARNIQGAAGARLGTLVEGTSAIVLAHLVGLIYNWVLTLVLVVVVPLYVFSGWLHMKISLGFATLSRRAFQEANDTAVECIENIQTVSSLGLESRFYQDFTRKLNKPTRCSLALAPLYGVSQGIMLLGYIIAFRFGAHQVTVDEDSVHYSDFQSVLKVFSAIVFASISVGLSGSLAPDYAAAKVSARKVLELLERQPNPDGYSEEGTQLDKVKGELQLKDIYFHYPSRPEVKVLQNVSIKVPPGNTLALVGESGSGKSTIFGLIEQFYSPVLGGISLDGVDYQDLNIRWLRSKIGIVSQEPVLFDMSIADNIRYGIRNGNVTDEDVVQVAIAANMHEFITSLPQGYSTNVGIKGTQLSGGQKQRIAIARAILQDPSILLLDEATSALDGASERAVQTALDRVQEGRTTIVITHRMATIENADVIVVLKNGAVTEVGTHKELMDKQGLYYRMATLQNIQ